MKLSIWRKVILILILLSILFALSGCQGTRAIQRTINAFSTVPQRIARGFTNIMSGIGDVGGALSRQIGNIIHNMTGR